MTVHRRNIQGQFQDSLGGPEIIVILGPRQVGKTTLLELLRQDIAERWRGKKDVLFFSLEDPAHLAALNRDPKYFQDYCIFSGADPQKDLVVLIDEIQNLQNPSKFMSSVNGRNPSIKLIVAGSTALQIKKFKQDIPKQKKVFCLHPLDFGEFLKFKGHDDLCSVKGNYAFPRFVENFEDTDAGTIHAIHQEMRLYFEEFVLYGGYPKVVLAGSKDEKMAHLREVMEAVEFKCVNVFFDVAKMSAFRSFLKVVASNSGELLNVNGLSRTLKIGRDTVRRYLAILEHAFLTNPLPPFHNNHAKEVKKMMKVYFYDTGLRNYAINNFSELRFRPDKDQLFKNAIGCELSKKCTPEDHLFYWRTIARNEVDFVLTGTRDLAFDVQATPNVSLKKPSGFRAFEKSYPKFKQFVINFEQFSDLDGLTFLPGWMV